MTLVLPEVADPEDAAALLADAAWRQPALEVRHAVGAEGHLPAPGATVVRPGRRQPWQVVTATQPLGGLTMLSPWRQFISARLAGERPSWAEGPITCNNDT